MFKWKCTICGYIYDEDSGETATETIPKTPFDKLPKYWKCPVCGAEKSAFIKHVESEIKAPAIESTVSDAMISELVKWGVGVVFGIPGTSSLGLVEAIRKNKDIKYIVVRHEENAAMAASAYNKLTGKIAACLTIAGPGATNLATGLYDAKEDHASVISINGQVSAQYTGPGGIQEIDQDAFFRPITVYNNTVYDKRLAVYLLSKALKFSTIKKGVSQISVPNNIQKETIDPEICRRDRCVKSLSVMPSMERISKASEIINESKKPVIIAGWGAYECADDILSLAKKIKAPVVITFRAKGIIPDDNEWLLGILGSVGTLHARKYVDDSDLLIVAGVGFSRFTNVPTDKKMVQIDLNPLKLEKSSEGISLFGSCDLVLPSLLEKTKEKKNKNILKDILLLKKNWLEQLELEADVNAVPIRPPYIMKILSEEIPDDAVISLDVGENQWWFGRNFQMKKQKFTMSGYLGTMGFGLPGAIAAKIAYPDKKVFCITGDGGFAMAMADFVTAVKYNLPMVVVILSNRQLGMIQVEQTIENYENFGTDLLNPDFSRYARACGGEGVRIEKGDDLKDAIHMALLSDKPYIIDINTDSRRF
ncbi:thiamine pyrophosphate-binding protein [Methanoplanus sp. FWC-SCC4]|uniref:Thiamine pyrophosphate-binding protein n=1 Tax=Methanochimaera problematica TaxID=2609417 RepID=A0AA97FCT8_9EURY|nr:thiamine pyrophosphate-dependent enzyme [Methanoplanus sp. FWC-SCC4]WOF15858.1 thiamine pyrophosphate-binding protein [Methanoplanus sp. FWC-SCC4]